MCLIVKKGYEPIISKNFIRGWKLVIPINKTEWSPIFRDGVYKFNEIIMAEEDTTYMLSRFDLNDFSEKIFVEHLKPIVSHLLFNNIVINAGFHAARNWWGVFLLLIRYKWCVDELLNTKEEKRAMKLVPIIIPEGAEYCFGEDGEIVATQMIIFDSKKSQQEYLKSIK